MKPMVSLRRAMLPTAALLAAVVVVGCGGSGSSPQKTGTTTAAGSPTPPTTTATPASTATTDADAPTSASTPTTTTTTSTRATTTTAAAASSSPPPCRASDLALSFLGQQGGMGEGEIGFVLRNVSGSSCRTYGYPGVLFLDRGGGALPTTPTHTTRDFFGTSPELPLVVRAGGSASFRLVVTHGVASSAGCTTAYGLQVIPPNDTATLRTTIPEGAYECQTAQVSPLRSGESAYP